ncbi:MAG: protein-disulfide reductase DsbD family protein [Spirochaetes bacterium]|nr:protein-disulfide reductase DsbD family protein [Spirochaetota bacterium]
MALACLFIFVADAQDLLLPAPEEAPVTAELAFDIAEIRPGSSFTAILALSHGPGWHTYGENPGDVGLSTSVEWRLPEGITAGTIRWPEPETIMDRGLASSGYSGRVELRIPMRASKDIAADNGLEIGATVRWLACKEVCVPGEAEFSFVIPVFTDGGSVSSLGGLLVALLGAFAGGLILNLMPCVLPVLSLKIHGFILQAGATRGQSLGNGLAYALGVLLSFQVAAGILLAFGAGGRLIGWGFQFQEPGFIAGMAMFFFAFALNMLGVFEVGTGVSGFAAGLERGEGRLRSFISGILATLVATPCTAPFMGTAIGFALSADAPTAFLVFGAMGLGMASPIVALSAFPGLASRLPKAGRWTETLKQALGFALLGTVVWLLSLLLSVAGPRSLVPVLAALLGAGAAGWILGRWSNLDRTKPVRIAARSIALVLFAACLLLAVSAASGSAATGDLAQAVIDDPRGTEPGLDVRRGLDWEAFSPELLAEIIFAREPAFVDFTADWCLTCRANEAAVLDQGRIAEEFERRGVRTLRADWTRQDPVIARVLAGYGRRSVPFYVLYAPGAANPKILPEILTMPIMLDALSAIARR